MDRYLEIEKKFIELVSKPVKNKEEMQEMENISTALRKEGTIVIKDLINELRSVGIEISSAWDLVNTSSSYGEAIPILLKHLSRPYPARIKEGIVRSLSVKEAKGIAGQAIIEEYNKTKGESVHYRWAFGNTMNTVISKQDEAGVLDIVKDKSNGESRHMFIIALGKIKTAQTEDALIELLDDDEVARYAINVLGKRKSKRAESKIIKLLSHPNPEIKKEAEKALERINRK